MPRSEGGASGPRPSGPSRLAIASGRARSARRDAGLAALLGQYVCVAEKVWNQCVCVCVCGV